MATTGNNPFAEKTDRSEEDESEGGANLNLSEGSVDGPTV